MNLKSWFDSLTSWINEQRNRLRDADLKSKRDQLPVPIDIDKTVSVFGSVTESVIVNSSPGRESLAIQVIGAMTVVAILFMAFAPIDRVVVGTGKVSPAGGAIYVQPLDRSIVNRVLVRTGDVVKKGQVLATLDATFAMADLKQMQEKRESSAALVARLEAEQLGHAYVPTPGSSYSQLQYSIWRQHQEEFRQNILAYDAKINSSRTLLSRTQQDIQDYSKKVQLASELEDMQTKLRERGFGSRIQAIGAAQEKVEANRMLSESRAQYAQSGHDVATIAAEKASFVSKWRDDLGAQLVQARNDLDQANSFLSKATRQQDLTSLVSPADAVVLEVGNLSQGAVVESNAATKPLFTLVPVRGATEADVEIDARDIAFIRKGDPVRVKFDAYRFTAHGTAEGRVESISEGSFTTSENGQSKPAFFKARIKIEQVKLRNVPASFRLVPGMTLQADILIGHRTMLSYILEGAMRTGSEAMREPQ